MSDYNYLFKNIIVGDTSVGKSCLMMQFIENRFSEGVDPTLGVEFGSRTLKIENSSIKIQIWDTAGQESFKSITRSYFRGAIGALVVFDLTARQSFENVSNWLNDIRSGASSNIEILLIGNKKDRSRERQISAEQAKKLADLHRIEYVEVSAKTGENVAEVFEKLAKRVLAGIRSGKIKTETEFGIKVGSRLSGPGMGMKPNGRRLKGDCCS